MKQKSRSIERLFLFLLDDVEPVVVAVNQHVIRVVIVALLSSMEAHLSFVVLVNGHTDVVVAAVEDDVGIAVFAIDDARKHFVERHAGDANSDGDKIVGKIHDVDHGVGVNFYALGGKVLVKAFVGVWLIEIGRASCRERVLW